MTVVPVGATLHDSKAVVEGLARTDAGKTYTRHAVHFGRQNNAMPVNRAVGSQVVPHGERNLLTLLPAQYGSGQLPIDEGCLPARAGEVDSLVTETEVETITDKIRLLRNGSTGRERANKTGRSQPRDKSSPRYTCAC